MSSSGPGRRLRGRRRECDALDRLVTNAKAGQSQVLVLRGEAGVGKSALLEYLVERAAGWESSGFGRTRIAVQLARSHLLYGEWLRREKRRREAREHLRTAYQMLHRFGAHAFADRARRELSATGESVRQRAAEPRQALTAQESQIARLAADGRTNSEIGAELFISPRTVEWHLHNVFTKLAVSSRTNLRALLAGA